MLVDKIEYKVFLNGNIFLMRIVWYKKSLPKINKKKQENTNSRIKKYFIKTKNNFLSLINKNKSVKNIKKILVNLVKKIKLRKKLEISILPFFIVFNGKKNNKKMIIKKRIKVSPVKVGHQ